MRKNTEKASPVCNQDFPPNNIIPKIVTRKYSKTIFANKVGSIGEGWINSNHAKPKNMMAAGQYFQRFDFPESCFSKFRVPKKSEISFCMECQGLIFHQILPNSAVSIVNPIHQITQTVNGNRFSFGSRFPVKPIHTNISSVSNESRLSQ